ncbi:MAG: hypothetical protein ACYC28_04155 [Longimicrobiales bacterium]
MNERAPEPGDLPGERGRIHRLRTDALALHHPDSGLVAAFDGAREQAGIAVRDEGDAAPPRRVVAFERAALAAYAALAVGAFDQARTRVAALAAERSGVVIGWLIGRYYAFTGDAEATQWLQPAVEALHVASSMPGTIPEARKHRDPLIAVVARELIATAEASADTDLAGMVRKLAQGAEPTRSVDAILRRLADVSAAEGERRPRQALTALFDGRTDDGVAIWESIVSDDTPGLRDWIVPVLSAGILGIDPDTERGRLRLRLHVPTAWPDWAATNIRLGDASVDLRIQRDARTVRITADQTAGALPLTLILEPTVHAPVSACFVDAHPADLALRATADHVIVPVQLALDAPRELTIELENNET